MPGERVVYFDGMYFALENQAVSFEGDFARHDLPVLPHFLALADASALRHQLGHPEYWFQRELPNRHDD